MVAFIDGSDGLEQRLCSGGAIHLGRGNKPPFSFPVGIVRLKKERQIFPYAIQYLSAINNIQQIQILEYSDLWDGVKTRIHDQPRIEDSIRTLTIGHLKDGMLLYK